jgi:hypothetical protein
MPVDRFFHPRAGHSRKVNGLTDQDFRVWWSYVLAADDYGVMRRSAVTLQAANDSLEKRSIKAIERSLDRLVDARLVVPFMHQAEPYVCQLDWQDFQKVRYPRESHLPIPPDDILAQCSRATQELFQQRSRKISEMPPEDSGTCSASDPQFPRARTHEEANANGKRLTADGSAPERVADAFRGHWKRTYGIESSLSVTPLQYAELEKQLTALGETQLMAAMVAFFGTDDAFVRKNKHPLGVFLRDPMRFLAAEAPRGGSYPTAEQTSAQIDRERHRVAELTHIEVAK